MIATQNRLWTVEEYHRMVDRTKRYKLIDILRVHPSF
jgi:hypothetical protein